MPARRFISDVVTQFRSLNERGERIAVMHGFGREFRDKRYSVFHKKGGRDNHFQGVQRLGNCLFVTGSFPYGKKRSDLLVLRLGSRASDPGPWGSNLMRDRDPPEIDRLVNYFQIDDDYWHPGGLALLGTVAAIPLENSQFQARLTFVDLADPENPERFTEADIDRPFHKAGACAITPVADGRILLAAWSDSDRATPAAPSRFHLDLYLSDKPGEIGGWQLAAQFFPAEDHAFHRKFQSLDFLWERTPAGTETLYLIAFENTSDAQPDPLHPGENRAYLFRLLPDLIEADAAPADLPGAFAELIDSRLFATSGNWCNMDAGACAYVDSNQQLIVYSVYHFMAPIRAASHTAPLVVKCVEFRATRFASPVLSIEDAWLDLYEEPGLEGRRLALLGPFDSTIADTRRISADDRPFDVVSSVRYQLPDDRAFVLYPEPDFGGAGPLVLTGTGDVCEVDVIAEGFGGAFRSCRFQLESVALALPEAIVV